MIGQTVSHYKITGKLGEGGMGVVYKAQDLKLNRAVALKFLHPTESGSAIKRFQQEALAASALNHPNILTIYDFEEAGGESFIAMEFVEGRSLKALIAEATSRNSVLPMDVILNYTMQIAEGLSKAHEKGIVHRDIKSDNAMVTDDGRVKIMDFGLAKLRGASKLTRTGATFGTLAYMAPEQLQGVEADRRADIYSFGVILYELVTGRLPFRGVHEAALMYEILNTDAPLPSSVREDVQAGMDRIILRCLEKRPEDRYSSAEELLKDLKAITNQASSGIKTSFRFRLLTRNRWKVLAIVASLTVLVVSYAIFLGNRSETLDSIAVLPFKNVNADPDVEYLSDGITENIINSLSQVSTLRVVPRSIVFSYKGKEADPQRVGETLKARAVLTGRIIQRGDDLNVQAELIDVSHQAQLWGEQYNRKMSDIMALQEEITKEISRTLRLQLTGKEKEVLNKRYTESNEAYQLYLKGNYLIQKSTPETLGKGLELMNRAIEVDPNFPLPYAGRASYYATITDFWLAPAAGMPEVKKAAARALELEEGLSSAHTWMGFYDLWYSWDWSAARGQLQRAIDLNPNEFPSHMLYSWYFLTQGRFPEAIEQGKRCVALEPLNPIVNAFFGIVLYQSHRFDEAAEHLQKSLDLEADFPFSLLLLGMCDLERGRFQEGIAELRKANDAFQSPWTLAKLGYGYARAGNKAEARKILATLRAESKGKYVPSDIVASIHAALGEKDRAFELLDRGFEERAGWMIWANVEPIWDPLRSDSRFDALLRRMNLDPRESGRRSSVSTLPAPAIDAPPIWHNSIAVLPFKNISPDEEQDYFCDGMTEQIITNLTNLPNVKVIARTSVMRFKNSDKMIQQIARELGVSHVLEGSVRKTGNKIRVTAQLINAADGFHVWAKEYDRQLNDVFAVQDDVSGSIARAFNLDLSDSQGRSFATSAPNNVEAYELYLKGRVHLRKGTEQDLETALKYFERALEKDPKYALAFAGISSVWSSRQQFQFIPAKEARPKLKEAAARALALDSTLAEVHLRLAVINTYSDWDWPGAERGYLTAIRLDPADPEARTLYSHFLYLRKRIVEAMAQIKRALELDPLSEMPHAFYATELVFLGRYDEAIAEARLALHTAPNHQMALTQLTMAYYHKRMYTESLAAEQSRWRARGDLAMAAALEQDQPDGGYEGSMRRAALTLAARSLKTNTATMPVASHFLRAGDREQALEWLEKSYEVRDPNMPYIGVARTWDPLRQEPRFKALLSKMGLEE